jgi:23S rRNA (cytosine1962-C5)-methyltransferase
MQINETVILKKGKEVSALRKHPWIFSGAVYHSTMNKQETGWVRVLDSENRFVALGYCSDSSIAVRIVSFQDEFPDTAFWTAKFSVALQVRKAIGFFPNADSNAFRLVNGEGDGIPGLVVDVYDDLAVLQFHHPFFEHIQDDLINGIRLVEGLNIQEILVRKTYEKSDIPVQEIQPRSIKENGLVFRVDAVKGQKTGFFLDQRENRALLERYSAGKKVLNTFCYTGGFSLYALRGGATEVVSVDVSSSALALLEENLKLNGNLSGRHQAVCTDVIPYLKEAGTDFDLIVLDPPAFAKSLSKRHNAIQAYKRLNAEALKQIKTGGVLFTFSCSQVVTREVFEKTVYSAALESGREVRILHRLTQAPDHTVSVYHQEGEYLKGLVLHVV